MNNEKTNIHTTIMTDKPNIIKSNWQQIMMGVIIVGNIFVSMYIQGQHSEEIAELKDTQKVEKELAIKEDRENIIEFNDKLAERTKIVNELEARIEKVKTGYELDSEKHNKEIIELRSYFEKEILILHYEIKLLNNN